MDILISLGQAVLLPFAGIAMYRLWKHIASHGKWIRLLVTAGLLGRAGFGLLLFWASYLPIRFSPGMEDDNGFWFYAWDGRMYFRNAMELAAAGPWEILRYDSSNAAAFYVKILASFVYLFGNVGSVGLLMNIFAFLGTCAALLLLFPRESPATNVAIGALSLSPSLILWTVQPLKDVVFLLLIVAFMAMAFAWHNSWRFPEQGTTWRRVGYALALIGLLHGISGIRWYFALLLLAASVLFFALSAKSWKPAVASLAVFAGLVWGFFTGGGAYVPEPLWELVRPATAMKAAMNLPGRLTRSVVGAREGFKKTAANTDIVAAGEQPNTSTAGYVPTPASKAPPGKEHLQPKIPNGPPIRVAVAAKKTEAPVPAVKEPKPEPQPAATSPAHVATTTHAPGDPRPAGSEPATPATSTAANTHRGESVAEHQAHSPAKSEPATPTVSKGTEHATATSVAKSEPPAKTTPAPATEPAKSAPAPQQASTKPAVTKSAERTVAPAPATTATTTASPPAAVTMTPVTTTVAPVAAAPAKPPASTEEGGGAVFRDSRTRSGASHASQLLVGLSAMLLPRFAGEALGLYSVGGGDGLWLFVELDTLYFDAVLLFSAIALISGLRRGGWRNPALALVVLTTVVIGATLAYTITNFGTLFRHRGMVFIGLIMIPLIVAAERSREHASPATEVPS